MCRFSSTPIPKSPVLGRLNTGISVLKKRAGSQNIGIRDPGIAIPNRHRMLIIDIDVHVLITVLSS